MASNVLIPIRALTHRWIADLFSRLVPWMYNAAMQFAHQWLRLAFAVVLSENVCMPVTREQLDNFHQFAARQLDNGGSELSLEQLLDLWRAENPTPDERSENVAAIQQALDDMDAGDVGEPADAVIQEVHASLSAADRR